MEFLNKRCDSCFFSTSGQIGLIDKFIIKDENLFVLARKSIRLHNPFYSISFPTVLAYDMNLDIK